MNFSDRPFSSEITPLFEPAIAACSVPMTIIDAQHPDWPTVYVNPEFEQQTGYDAAEVRGQSFQFLQQQDLAQPGLETIRTALKAGTRATALLRSYRKDGSLFWGELTISPIQNARGEITHFVGSYHTVCDRVEAEQVHVQPVHAQPVHAQPAAHNHPAQLQQAYTLLTHVLDQIPLVVFWKDRNSVYLGCNQAFATVAGVGTPDQIIGKTDYELAWTLEEAEEYRKNDDRIMRAGTAEVSLIEKQTQANGRLMWTETSKIPLTDDQGQVCGILGAFRDISVRKTAEDALREREAELRNITSLVPGVLYQYQFNFQTEQGRFTYISPRSSEVFELEPDVLQNSDAALWQMLHEEDQERVQWSVMQAVLTHQPWSDEYRIITPSGQEKWIRGQSQTGHITEEYSLHYGIFFDVSDRKATELQLQQRTWDLEETLKNLQRAQAQLIQSEKMSSLGQLVAGIAHEINNPMNFISGNLTYAQQYVLDLFRLLATYEQTYPQPPEAITQVKDEIDLEFLKADLPSLLSSMRTGAERIRQIVLSLRLFSRLDEAEYKETNLHEAIESTLMLLDYRLQQAEIQLHRQYSLLPRVECYAGQLNQAFLNIIENAIDALQTTPAPILKITTEPMGEKFVKISISDNGVGMAPEIQQRIFDPFFTTKEVGQGTGMGLAISYQIVAQQHRGLLHCESQVGAGTTFTIEIPIKLKLPA